MARRKDDEITFQTTLSVSDLADCIREAQRKTKADGLDRLEDDALGGIGGGQREAIGVVMYGRLGMLGGMKHFRAGAANNIWGVQIYVFDHGQYREVVLVAMGQSVFSSWTGRGTLNLGSSKENRAKILQIIQQADAQFAPPVEQPKPRQVEPRPEPQRRQVSAQDRAMSTGAPRAAAAAPAAAASADAPAKFCTECGSKIDAAWKFCKSCGARL